MDSAGCVASGVGGVVTGGDKTATEITERLKKVIAAVIAEQEA